MLPSRPRQLDFCNPRGYNNIVTPTKGNTVTKTEEKNPYVSCDGCGEDGFILADEVFLYDLPTGLTPLCLNCGPEENYAELLSAE